MSALLGRYLSVRSWSARGTVVCALAAVVFSLSPGSRLTAQADPASDARHAPRFFLAMNSGRPEPMDVSRVPVLRQRLALDLEGVTVKQAITAISRQSGLVIWYSDDVLHRNTRVHLRAEAITVAAALTDVLMDAGVDVVFSGDGTVSLVKRTATAAPSQGGAVMGRVTDASTQQGIEGARVFLEGTRWGTTTGSTGHYRLSGVAAGSYTLVTRRLGFRVSQRAVVVEDYREVTLDVALEPVPSALNEVVVTATGEQRRVELGHVVGRINADSVVREAPVSTLSELLTARVPGLQVFQAQGIVGGQVNVQIRGPNSFLLSNEPIVIVDGVRYTSAQRPASLQDASSFSGGRGVIEPTSPLNDINPNDIETIEVVKGPSAATLYGTDAANGVLVITTKRGAQGRARWNTYTRVTTTEIRTRDFPEIYWGWGTVFGVRNDSTYNCSLEWLALGLCSQQDSVTVLPNPLNDPSLTMFRARPAWQHGMNVAGGRENLTYFLSGDFEDATGPLQMPPALADQLKAQRGLRELPREWEDPNTFSKLNLRANVAAGGLGGNANLQINTAYVRSSTRSAPAASASPYSAALQTSPAVPYGLFGSPVEALLRTSTERTDRFIGTANGQWSPATWLTTSAVVGLDYIGGTRYTIARRGDMPNDFFSRNGIVTDERLQRVTTTADLRVTAIARRGRLNWRTSAGAQYVRAVNDALGSEGSNLPPGGTSVGDAAFIQSRQSYGETATLGAYFEESAGLNDRLFLTAALRVDGASTFGRGYNAATYPKAGVSWLISEEPFLTLPGFDELRLRFAFGISGQQPDPAWARPAFEIVPGVQGGTITNTVWLAGLGNPNLRPERVREHEFGFDASAFSNRFGLQATWYRRKTADQMVPRALPPGFGTFFTNLGLTKQTGFEAQVDARVLNTRFLTWALTAQHGSHTTQVLELGDGMPCVQVFSATLVIPSFAANEGCYAEGYPLGARFAFPVLGYSDANGDGILTFQELQHGDTVVYMGQSTPPRSQTLSTTLGFFNQRVRLSALLERRSGFTQVNQLKCGGFPPMCRELVEPGTPLARQAEMKVNVPEPGDFTRLREITIALDVPRTWTNALRLSSATGTLSARNLALWTDFSGPDPESATIGFRSALSGGVANGIPQGRSLAFRLDVGL